LKELKSVASVATFAVVGGGFRAEAFLRVADALPERLRVSGIVVRNPERREVLQERWRVPVLSSLGEVISGERPDFVVLAVRPSEAVPLIRELVGEGLAVLTETPAAPDVPGLRELTRLVRGGGRIQVAEQYHLEPLLQAQQEVVGSGLLGTVTEAFVSVAHDYHGISVLRRMLGVGFEPARIVARRFTEQITEGPSRYGAPESERVIDGIRTTAWLDFGEELHGTYDFDDQQYRSWIRSPSLLVRGSRGELRDETVRYLEDFDTPAVARLERLAAGGAGNHEGLFLRGYTLNGARVYSNDYLPARLADEELSIASLLTRMGEYVDGGAAVYSVAEAAQDQYLQLMVRRAAESGEAVLTERHEWAEE
jgi:hypothetical protein